jgi:hypothetical protein
MPAYDCSREWKTKKNKHNKIQYLMTKLKGQNRNFFIPKIIAVNDLFKLSLNSYAAKDTICVLFWQKRPKTIVIGIIVQDDKHSI